jgi:uncharacterized membrane protein
MFVHFPIALALLAAGAEAMGIVKRRRLNRIFLFASALGIGVTAHLGGMLVWGQNFLHI